MAKAALLTLHGMGEQQPGYSYELRLELKSRLGARAGKLAVEEVFYQDLLQDPERRYWEHVRSDLRWHDLRKFMLFGWSDVVAIESDKQRPQNVYTAIQVRIAAALIRAWKSMGRQNGPIVFIAHSSGGHVLSNFLWDAQRAAAGRLPEHGIWKSVQRHAGDIAGAVDALDHDELAFLQRPNVQRLFTTGCTIPLYLASHRRVEPIEKPSAGFEWHNYYDRDDLLGWPLAAVSAEYAALVSDHPTHFGGTPVQWLLKSANPLVYGSYWSEADVLDPLCEALKTLLDGQTEPDSPWPRAPGSQRPLPVKS